MRLKLLRRTFVESKVNGFLTPSVSRLRIGPSIEQVLDEGLMSMIDRKVKKGVSVFVLGIKFPLPLPKLRQEMLFDG